MTGHIKIEIYVLKTNNSTNNKRGPKPKLYNREIFIQAGIEMFYETGYSASSINDIVNKANLPKGSFYNYFESKETFVKEVIDTYFNEALINIRKLLEDTSIPPLHRLKQFFNDRICVFKENGYIKGCLIGNLSLEIADHNPVARSVLEQHLQTWSNLFANCIEEAQTNNMIQNKLPSILLAKFLLNSWEGALIRMKVEKNDTPLQDFMKVVFGIILI